ncbi:ester cyclase [Microbispora sp. NPDC049125]|uniref:ester cyclase n=1 Tax=Microbispora sp. NPDC049125 TaxID=3154929 RepID=UPI0034664215
MSDMANRADCLLDAMNAHDLEAALLCYTDEAVYVSPAGIGEGRDQIASFLGVMLTAFPDVRWTPWNTFVVCGNVVITQWTITGTHLGPILMPNGEVIEATGRPINVRGCSLRTMDGDRIAVHCVFYDQLELYAQLGAELVVNRP